MIARTGHYEIISREAFPYLIPPAFLALLFWWLSFPITSLLFLTIAACTALFFRNPDRSPPPGEGLVVSPADGRVIAIVEDARSSNPETTPLKRVSVFMSVFNVHVNRAPISAVVKRIRYTPGGFLDAREQASSEENERNSLILESDSGIIEVVQVAGKVARRISCWVRPRDRLCRGDRFGMIHFGSRLDVFLPPEFSVSVQPGTRVRAGVTVIARRLDDPGSGQ